MNQLLLDHISFSQMKTAMECPYQYYLPKLEDVVPEENGFAQAGVLAHELLGMWARGEASPKDLPKLWTERFPLAVTAPFPPFLATKGYANKLYTSVLNYFERFSGFPGYEVIGVEKQFISSLAGEKFIGVIDLILRNENGGLMIMDHKSCSLSSFRRSRDEMYKQLYLYSKYTADTYGTFPKKLCFNLFKENVMDEQPFDPEIYMATRIWAENTIQEMKDRDITDWFEVKPEQFRCTCLCSARNECRFGKPESHKKTAVPA